MKVRGPFAAVVLIAVAAIGSCALLNWHDAEAKTAADAPPTLVSVQVGTLRRMTIHQYVTGYGFVAPAPATVDRPAAAAAVAAPVSGVVARVKVVAGQRVRRGQTLVVLNSGTMTAAYAAQELARQRRLYAQHNTSLKALQNAEAALSLLRVTAPLSGRVVAVNVKPGASVAQTAALVEIMDLHRLVVQTEIPAGQATTLRVGQTVQLRRACPDTTRLSYIGPTVDPSDGAVKVWAPLPAKCGLRPGQYLSLRIVTATHRGTLVAPADSIVTDLAGHSALSVVHGNTAVRTAVRAGLHEGAWTEVSGAGLTPGTKVVTVGAYGLPARTRIRIVNARAAPPPARNRFAEPP